MTNLSSIPGLGKASLELLEAAGTADAESLAKADVDELLVALDHANLTLKIVKRLPARGKILNWIASARELTGMENNAGGDVALPVNYELSPQVLTMLGNAPFAIPLPASILMENQLAVADIPPAIMLNRYSGDIEVRVEERVPAPKIARPAVPASNIRLSETNGTRVGIDSSRFKTINFPVNESNGGKIPALTNGEDLVSLIRGPRTETNEGRNPESRRYIRGVLHSHAVSLSVGALVTLIMAFMLPASMISAGLLLASREMPEKFGWVPEWLLAFPVCLPVFGLAYLIWGVSGRCRICRQNLFVPRMCLKNPKVHHIPGLGHIIPLALHVLLFKWFRCSYCGTAVRVKK